MSTQPSQWTRDSRRSPRPKINMHVKVWRRIKGEKKLVQLLQKYQPGRHRNFHSGGDSGGSKSGAAIYAAGVKQINHRARDLRGVNKSTKPSGAYD